LAAARLVVEAAIEPGALTHGSLQGRRRCHDLQRGDDDRDVREFREFGRVTGSEECARAAAAASTEHDHRSRFIARGGRQPPHNITDLAARLSTSIWHFVVQNRGRRALSGYGNSRQAVEHMHRNESSAELSG
jgi:hypothetical protein